MVLFTFLLIITHMAKVTILCELPGVYAIENLLFRNKRTTLKLLKSETTEKLLYCTRYCLDDSRCMSFFYSEISNECQLHSVTFVENSAVTNDHGWKYYQVFTGACPPFDGYLENRELKICYKLYAKSNVDVSVYRSTCASDGGELLKIDSQEKQDHVVDFLENVDIEWINIQGDDVDQEGTWRYDDGTPLIYTNWNPGQPDNGILRPNQDVVFLRRAVGYAWQDQHSTYPEPHSAGFICQKII